MAKKASAQKPTPSSVESDNPGESTLMDYACGPLVCEGDYDNLYPLEDDEINEQRTNNDGPSTMRKPSASATHNVPLEPKKSNIKLTKLLRISDDGKKAHCDQDTYVKEWTAALENHPQRNVDHVTRYTIKKREFGAGTKVMDEYEIKHILETGSTWTVYTAHAIKSDKPVLLKIEQEGPIQLFNEVILIKKLKHQNTKCFMDVIEWAMISGGYKVVVMPHSVGPTLEELLFKHGGRFIEGCALSVSLKCLTAIECLHKIDCIHRDINPANFRISQNGRNIVLFHLYNVKRTKNVKNWALHKNNSYPAGNLKYISINAHFMRELTMADDLESFVYMFQEMLTGKLPWTGICNENVVYGLKTELAAVWKQQKNAVALECSPLVISIGNIALAKNFDSPSVCAVIRKKITHYMTKKHISDICMYDWETRDFQTHMFAKHEESERTNAE